MNEYELRVMQKWIREEQQHSPLSIRLIKGLSGPISGMLHAVQKIHANHPLPFADRIQRVVQAVMIKTIEQAATASQFAKVEGILQDLGSSAHTASEIQMLPLQIKDEASRQLKRAQTFNVATEGAIAGMTTSLFEMIPGLQGLLLPAILADLTATVYLMAQNAVQVGYSYGYTLQNPEDLPHFLFAIAPTTADAMMVEAKLSAHLALRETGIALARSMSGHLSVRLLASANPALEKMIDLLSTRIMTALAEKEFSLLIPIAGAALQASVNMAFANDSHRQATRYFQHLHLSDRYGEAHIEDTISAMRAGRPA